MKKYCMLLLLGAALPFLSIACDICGCGVGNNYIGILPEFHKHIFGLRYRYNSMLTHLGVNGSLTYLTTKDTYNTVEAWGGWNITKRFRVMASVPYGFNERMNQGVTSTKSGVGDITAAAYYQLLNNRHAVGASKLLVQSLWLGGGVKLATGKYNPQDKNSTADNANLFQLGTGSTDFNISAMYDIRLQDNGVNISSSYKITTANRYKYEYGNKFNINAQLYHKFNIQNKLVIAPNAGVQYESAKSDLDNAFKVTVSGGNLLLGTAGIEAALGKIAFGGNIQIPFSQNLARGIVKADNRVMLHVAIAL